MGDAESELAARVLQNLTALSEGNDELAALFMQVLEEAWAAQGLTVRAGRAGEGGHCALHCEHRRDNTDDARKILKSSRIDLGSALNLAFRRTVSCYSCCGLLSKVNEGRSVLPDRVH